MTPLHITNGDAANKFLQSIGIEGCFLSWDEVLHQGPIALEISIEQFSQLRADYMSRIGWGSSQDILAKLTKRNEIFQDAVAHQQPIIIWNSWELFDQLHLMQLCDWFYRNSDFNCPVKAVFVPDYIGSPHIAADKWHNMLAQAECLSFEQMQLGERLWKAWGQPTPEALVACWRELEMKELPFIKPAIERLIQELPAKRTGLSHSEKLTLKAISKEPQSLADIFKFVCAKEKVSFMGDLSFIDVVHHLSNSDMPLMLPEDKGPFSAKDAIGNEHEWRQRPFYLTDQGQDVLQQRLNWLSKHHIDRWWGGAHLTPKNDWRWDAKSNELICKS